MGNDTLRIYAVSMVIFNCAFGRPVEREFCLRESNYLKNGNKWQKDLCLREEELIR